MIHHTWTPIQERIKDYIASPKSNAYQSLHTTIFGPAGQLFEVQIRTEEMHRTAENGIAAHWLYKTEVERDEFDQALGWFRQLLELQQDVHSPEEFLEFLKVDLYQDEIFVFTPEAMSNDSPREPRRSTSPSASTPRSGCGVRAPRSMVASHRSTGAQERGRRRDPHQLYCAPQP